MIGAAENVADFMADELLHFRTGGAEVFARIEFLRVFREGFADAGGHREAKVGVNVHLRAADAPGDFDVGLGHAGGVFAEFAAVFVNLFS